MYLHYFSDIVCNYFTMAEKSNKEILVDAWKDRGTVDYNDSFKKISDTEVEHLKRTIKKMGGALTEKHDGVNLCIADDHYKMAKKEPTPTAKKLLLSSGQMLYSSALSIKDYDGKKL